MPHDNHSFLTASGVATLVAWLPNLDMYLRMGASAVAIISGCLAIAYYVRKLRAE